MSPLSHCPALKTGIDIVRSIPSAPKCQGFSVHRTTCPLKGRWHYPYPPTWTPVSIQCCQWHFKLYHAATTPLEPILVQNIGSIGITVAACLCIDLISCGYSAKALLPSESPTLLVLCKMELEGLPLCSSPEFEPCLVPFIGPTTPFPAIPLHPTPVTFQTPYRHGLPLLKIFFTGHRVRAGAHGGYGYDCCSWVGFHSGRFGQHSQSEVAWSGPKFDLDVWGTGPGCLL